MVDGIELRVAPGEVLALVGESGCGKSMTALSILRLVPKPGRDRVGPRAARGPRRARVRRRPRCARSAAREIAMIFQEPMTSLNPVQTVGAQVVEAIRLHERVSAGAARRRASSCSSASGSPIADARFERLSAPALGRTQAARDDRDGALDAAQAPDRRRADHRARRDDPGADPRAACASCSASSAWRSC